MDNNKSGVQNARNLTFRRLYKKIINCMVIQSYSDQYGQYFNWDEARPKAMLA